MKLIMPLQCLLFLLPACHFQANSAGTASQGELFAVNSLPSAAILTKDFFRKYAMDITDAEFAARWDASLKSPLKFLRSHVMAYYAITAATVISGSPKGYCFGDAHPVNFGFTENKNGKPFFAYNDFDDSGICPVSLDALRFFTSLRLLEKNSDTEDLVDYYVALLGGSGKEKSIDNSFIPDFKQVRKDVLANDINGDKFVRDANNTIDVSNKVAADATRAAQEAYQAEGFPAPKVLDVIEALNHGGGSLGLVRYWVLSEDAEGMRDIVELKREATPATSFGKWGTVPGVRLETLKEVIWGNRGLARIYKTVSINGNEFVARSRIKLSFDPTTLKGKERIDSYKVELSLMAVLHKQSYGIIEGKAQEKLAKWLKDGSDSLGKLYGEVANKVK